MAHSSCIKFDRAEEVRLLEVARQSIAHGLLTQRPLRVDPAECVGALGKSLGVATAAFNAAFNDARFAPLTTVELEYTQIEISVLSAPATINVSSEAELIATLTPLEDGLILEDRGYQATFLPQVWEKINDPRQFVRELKAKAGLAPDYWSDTTRCYRYHTTSIIERRERAPTEA